MNCIELSVYVSSVSFLESLFYFFGLLEFSRFLNARVNFSSLLIMRFSKDLQLFLAPFESLPRSNYIWN